MITTELARLTGQRETLTLDSDLMLVILQMAIFGQAVSNGIVNPVQLQYVAALQRAVTAERYEAAMRAVLAIAERQAATLGTVLRAPSDPT